MADEGARLKTARRGRERARLFVRPMEVVDGAKPKGAPRGPWRRRLSVSAMEADVGVPWKVLRSIFFPAVSVNGVHNVMVSGCSKAAQGKTQLCIGHGGGSRCMFKDCTKGVRSARGVAPFCCLHRSRSEAEAEGASQPESPGNADDNAAAPKKRKRAKAETAGLQPAAEGGDLVSSPPKQASL